MSRDFSVFLEDIIEAIGYIREYTAGYSFEDFTKDRKTRDAVVRKFHRSLRVIVKPNGKTRIKGQMTNKGERI